MSRRLRWTVLLVALLAAGGGRAVLVCRGLVGGEGAGGERAGGSIARVLPSGLRLLAADAVWLRAIADLDDGRFQRLRSDVDLLVQLLPDPVFAISYFADQYATTVGRHGGDPGEELEWLEAAVQLVETGLRLHPTSSILHARLGEIYLGLLTRDPPIRAAFRERDGRSPAEAALDSFEKALDLDRESGRQESGRGYPEIVLCLFLVAEERISDDDLESARALMARAEEFLRDHPGGVHPGEEPAAAAAQSSEAAMRRQWHDHATAWVALLDEAILRKKALREGRTAEADTLTRSLLERLDGMLDRYPEDTLAKEFRDRLRSR